VAFQPYNLLLTAAVGAGNSSIENGYEIDKLAPHLDFINLMTYDFHGGSWENVTGFHTALYARPEEDPIAATANQVIDHAGLQSSATRFCIVGLGSQSLDITRYAQGED
jgi:GH18 family chitinase